MREKMASHFSRTSCSVPGRSLKSAFRTSERQSRGIGAFIQPGSTPAPLDLFLSHERPNRAMEIGAAEDPRDDVVAVRQLGPPDPTYRLLGGPHAQRGVVSQLADDLAGH